MLDKRYGYFTTAMEKTSEPIRQNRWVVNLNFSELSSSGQFPDAGTLTYSIKETDFPGFKTETDSLFYFGVERKLTTSVSNVGQITLTILEGENLIGYNSMLRWLQQCANINQLATKSVDIMSNSRNKEFIINAPNYSKGEFVNSNVLNIEVFSYVTGAVILRADFKNIRPFDIGNVRLSSESNELYKFNVSFDYDYATITGNIGKRSPVNNGVLT